MLNKETGELEISHTNVFTWNLEAYESGKRCIINQGGARSSKTYSIIQLLAFLCLTNDRLSVDVVRESLAALRRGSMKDFFDIIKDWGIYNESNHNMTSNIYTFDNGSFIQFFSTDESQKLRGTKRDICYCNEANELSLDKFVQLNIRTTKCLFLDFNPSDNDHWIYNKIEEDDSVLIKSTYLDNIYLPDVQKRELENLISVDENYYKIYVLGERPIAKTRIYSHFQQFEYQKLIDNNNQEHTIPDGDVCYGLDFGFNDPTVLIKCTISDKCYYFEEIIYQQFLTTSDLVNLMNSLNVDKNKYIYCDHRPEVVEELRRHGYNVKNAEKNIKDGIIKVKSVQVYIHKDSINTLKEFKLYSWKSKGEIILDEPIDLNNHAMDCIRYCIFSEDKAKYNPHLTRLYVPKKKIDFGPLTRRSI